MVDLTFRTVGAWGAGKGANLAPTEVDNNFWSLAQAIFNLQNDAAVPVGIASITVSGTEMTIHLTDGTALGPYTLPVLTFRWRNEWTPSTIYAVLDVFTVTNVGIYMVEIAHTSGPVFDPNLLVAGLPALKMLFGLESLAASPIAEGTMLSNISGVLAPAVANTLTAYLDHVLATTTRGTILFRGGTTWVALAPGTSGQVLSTGGSVGDPSWITTAASPTDSIASFTAAGSDQATATALTARQNYVAGATGTNGVRIDTALMISGQRFFVVNEHPANNLLFYPGTGMAINSQAVNTPIPIYANSTGAFIVKSGTQLRSVP